ncbi:hypothetical protein ACOMHN_026790 [Nucella lapillus]
MLTRNAESPPTIPLAFAAATSHNNGHQGGSNSSSQGVAWWENGWARGGGMWEGIVHPHWLNYAPLPYAFHVCVGVLMVFTALSSLVGNGLVLWSFFRFRSLRTSSNLFIISLALADILMSSVDFPLFATASFLGYWSFGYHEACHLFVATMTTMTTRANLHLRPSSDAQPVEVCQLFVATMTTMTTRANLHLRPSSNAQPVEDDDDDDNASQTSSASVIGRPTRRGLSPVRGDGDDDDNASQSLSASVIGRPTRRGLPPVRYYDDDDDNATQTSSASVIGRPTRRGLSPVRYDDDDDDNASQTSSASVIGRPTRRGLSPVRGDGDDDDNASQSSSASVIGRPTRRGLSPVRYDDDDASQSSSDDRALCQLYGSTTGIAGLVTINTLAAISYDRYTVVVRHVGPVRYISKSMTLKVILVIWLLSVLWIVLPLAGWSHYTLEGIGTTCTFDYLTRTPLNVSYVIVLMVTNFLFPLLVILYSYARIFMSVASVQRGLMDCSPEISIGTQRQRFRRQTEMKTASSMLIIVTFFCLSWTPYVIVSLIGLFGDVTLVSPVVSALPCIFAKVATVSNPPLYSLGHPKFRKKIRYLVKSSFRRSFTPPNSHQTTQDNLQMIFL